MTTTHQPISGLSVSTILSGFYILSSFTQRMTQAGKPYLNGVLLDAAGRVPFVMWDNLPLLSDIDVGKVVFIDGEAQEYRNVLQIKVNTLRLATDDDAEGYQLSDLVPYAPIDIENAANRIYAALLDLKDCFYGPLVRCLYMDIQPLLPLIPAAKSIHHAFVGGWAMHTWNMMAMAELVYSQYKDIMPIDHDLLIAGTFLHDIGKLREFELTEQSLVKDYSEDGRLLGHPTLGVMMIEQYFNGCQNEIDPRKLKLLEHIIVSHHGSPECGAAVYPQTVEAEIVHRLDSLDSRLEIFRDELSKTPVGKFGDLNRALEHCVYHHSEVA